VIDSVLLLGQLRQRSYVLLQSALETLVVSSSDFNATRLQSIRLSCLPAFFVTVPSSSEHVGPSCLRLSRDFSPRSLATTAPNFMIVNYLGHMAPRVPSRCQHEHHLDRCRNFKSGGEGARPPLTAAQLDAEAGTARLRAGAEAPGPNTSIAASRRLHSARRGPAVCACGRRAAGLRYVDLGRAA
jgi:hypothetical protein